MFDGKTNSPEVSLVAAGVRARNDGGAPGLILVSWAISGILAAPDTSAIGIGLDQLDVMRVTSALRALWVAPATSSAGGIVLSSTICQSKCPQSATYAFSRRIR